MLKRLLCRCCICQRSRCELHDRQYLLSEQKYHKYPLACYFCSCVYTVKQIQLLLLNSQYELLFKIVLIKVKKSIAQDPSAVITWQAENRQFRFKTLPYFAKFHEVTAEFQNFLFAMAGTGKIKATCLLALGRLSVTFLWPFHYNRQGSLITLTCLFSLLEHWGRIVECIRI